jgi:hypothetical protein
VCQVVFRENKSSTISSGLKIKLDDFIEFFEKIKTPKLKSGLEANRGFRQAVSR